MPESASGLMTEVAALTHATTQLLNTVNVRKATLDASVDAASGSATSAANSAQSASVSAASAATTLDETEAARNAAQTYRDQAVAVVTSNDGSFESAPGKVPVAGLDGKIDYDYLPLASQNAIVAEALIRSTHENLLDFFDDKQLEAQVQSAVTGVANLNNRVSTEVTRLDQAIAHIEPGIPPAYEGLIDQDFLIDGFESAYTAELLRGMGGSGLFNVRNYANDDGPGALHRPFAVSYSAHSQHNHPNYYRMIGLGELTALVNGYYVRMTHNDPILADQDNRYLDAPPVPTAVLGKPTGLTLNADGSVAIDTANDTQARHMRNLFTDHLDDTRLDLLYAEVWLEKLPTSGDLNTLIQSFRHRENASRLQDLLTFAQRLNFSGAKDLGENGSFRCGVISHIGEDGTPEYAYINYRVRATPVGKLSNRVAKTSYAAGDETPTITFAVVASGFGGTHGHSLQVPLSPAEMNTLIGGGTLYVETGYGKADASPASENHTHLEQLTWNGSTIVAQDIGARAIGVMGNTFLAVGGATPGIASYRRFDGTLAGPVVWDTSVSPHIHPIDVQFVQDRFPFDLVKAVSHTLDATNRFKLVKDLETLARLREGDPSANWLALATSGYARFTLDQSDMDALCTQVWGLDGEGAFIAENINSYGTVYTTFNPDGRSQANLAKYNRNFVTGTRDAAGRAYGRRGFNDPTLYVARTTRPEVVEGYSYMIPLELIVRSSLEIWNPWNLRIIDGPLDAAASGDGSRASPWNAAYTHLWWNLLPPNFFSAGISDPSDTVRGGVWIRANDGNAYPADNSGIYITVGNAANYRNASGTTVSTTFRQRYPIAPLWHEFSYANVQVNNLRNTLRALLKGLASGSVTVNDIDNFL
jgi:hypothetical protein